MKLKAIIIIFIIIVGLIVSYNLGRNVVQIKEPNSDYLYHTIDSLNKLISDMEFKVDSLQHRIDTSKMTIINIHKDYEQKYINLSNAPLSEQLSFFTEYLSKGN